MAANEPSIDNVVISNGSGNPSTDGGSSNPFAGGGNPFAGGENPFIANRDFGSNNATIGTGNWDLSSNNATIGNGNWLRDEASYNATIGNGNWFRDEASYNTTIGNGNWYLNTSSDNSTLGNGNWSFGSDNSTIGNGNWDFGNNNVVIGNGNWVFTDNNVVIGNGNWFLGDDGTASGTTQSLTTLEILFPELKSNVDNLIDSLTGKIGGDFTVLTGDLDADGSQTFEELILSRGNDGTTGNSSCFFSCSGENTPISSEPVPEPHSVLPVLALGLVYFYWSKKFKANSKLNWKN